MKKLVVFASGSGTNAQRIAEYFRSKGSAQIVGLFCNRADAFVLRRAEQLRIPSVVFDRNDFYDTGNVLAQLRELSPDLIVLAGFLWRVPEEIIRAFPQKIVNIHPALLPSYGGKGMYGHHVHEAVVNSREAYSGITIHYVNERYDEGAIIMQARCAVLSDDTADSLAARIHGLEYLYFPVAIEQVLGLE